MYDLTWNWVSQGGEGGREGWAGGWGEGWRMECTEEGLQNGSTNAGSWLMHSEGVVGVEAWGWVVVGVRAVQTNLTFDDVELHVLGCRLTCTIRDKLHPVPKHGSMLLYVHRKYKVHSDGEPRTATSTFTQLWPYCCPHGPIYRFTVVPLSSVPNKPYGFCGR